MSYTPTVLGYAVEGYGIANAPINIAVTGFGITFINLNAGIYLTDLFKKYSWLE